MPGSKPALPRYMQAPGGMKPAIPGSKPGGKIPSLPAAKPLAKAPTIPGSKPGGNVPAIAGGAAAVVAGSGATKDKEADKTAKAAAKKEAALLLAAGKRNKKAANLYEKYKAAMKECDAKEGGDGTVEKLEKARDAIIKEKQEEFDKETFAAGVALIAGVHATLKLKKLVLDLNGSTIAELKHYSTPPPEVVSVMSASFLLLGCRKQDVAKWDKIQLQLGKLGKESVMRRMKEFKLSQVTDETAAAASTALDEVKCDRADIENKCGQACSAFYGWSSGMMDQRKRNRVSTKKR